MAVLVGEEIAIRGIFDPHLPRTNHKESGKSYGQSFCGYDVRIAQDVFIPEGGFVIASIIEYMEMPTNVVAFVHDKSTWVRDGLSVFNTVIEPGWMGYLTIELSNANKRPWWKFWEKRKHLVINKGTPIAQIIFHDLTKPVQGYDGKYQNQPNRPVPAMKQGEKFVGRGNSEQLKRKWSGWSGRL